MACECVFNCKAIIIETYGARRGGVDLRSGSRLLVAVLVITVVVLVAFLFGSGSQKIAGDWAGISLHSLSEGDAELVKESGAGWIRIDCFEDVDSALANAEAQGLKVLAILDSWTMNNRTVFSLDEWESNVTYYVAKYADYVNAWEIWNEPANPNVKWTLLNGSLPEDMSQIVEFYYSMVQVASPIIRQYNPDAAIVLFGGLNLFSGADPNLEYDKDFAARLAAMGIEQYGDAFSVHAYPWTDDTSLWSCRAYDDALEYYQQLFPSLEVWLTETGHYVDSEGELGQAQYMRDAVEYFKGKVTRFFWYSLQDNPGEQQFGLVENGKLRLAYHELKDKLR
jgi:hypothetical protein